VVGFCEHGNELSGSIKKSRLLFEKLSEWLSTFQIISCTME
jgi:hypothetical protein